MIKCKRCQTDKPEDQMKLRAGKPSKVCLECDGKRKAEAERLAGIVAKAKQNGRRGGRKAKRRSSPNRVAAEAPADEVEVEAGLGFKAFLIDDGRLQISQDGDNVVLSRTEFKVITAQFAEWRDAPTT